jgi:hypothetical protein
MSVIDGGTANSTFSAGGLDGGEADSTFSLNSTGTYWAVDGISLQTMAFDIQSTGGDRMAPPPLRGRDITVPYAPGDMHVPKQVGARTITLDMFVLGATEDGEIPPGTAADQFDKNFRKLRRLLWTPNRRFTLTKRFRDDDGVLRTVTAQGQYAGGLSPAMTGRTRALFSVDIRLADPYFYGPEITKALVTGNNTVTVYGDDITRAVKLHVVGPRNKPKVRNATLNVTVEYNGDISSGDVLDVDVKNFSSVTDPAAIPPYSSTGKILHSGDAFWLVMQPGDNTLAVSSTSGIGGVTMTYQEVWL